MKSSRKEDGGGECNSLAFRGASRSASATTAEISRLASCRLRFNRERGRKGKDSSSFFVLLSPRFPRGFSGVATMSCIAHGVSPIDQQRACRNTCLRKVYATRATRTETDLVPRPAATPPLLHRFSSERERGRRLTPTWSISNVTLRFRWLLDRMLELGDMRVDRYFRREGRISGRILSLMRV